MRLVQDHHCVVRRVFVRASRTVLACVLAVRVSFHVPLDVLAKMSLDRGSVWEIPVMASVVTSPVKIVLTDNAATAARVSLAKRPWSATPCRETALPTTAAHSETARVPKFAAWVCANPIPVRASNAERVKLVTTVCAQLRV